MLRAALIILTGIALGGCATNPVTGDRDFALVSEPQEIAQGRQYHQQIVERYGIYDDPVLQQYVDRVGRELAANSHRAHLDFTFTVLDSPDINAFALPGGYVYVTRGIMAYLDSEAELAGVLGHEIGHVTARHSVRQQAGQFASGLLSILVTAATGSADLGNLSQTIGSGIVRGYGREHELEADRLGAEYLHRSGYDPENMLEVIGVLKDQEIYERELARRENREPNIYHGVFSTHPRNDDRLQTVVRAAKKLSAKQYRDNNRVPYRDRIDGIAWGPSLRQGVVYRSRFSHPQLAFRLDLPRGWQVQNRPEILQVRDPASGAVLQIGVEKLAADESPGEFLRRFSKDMDLDVKTQSYGVTAVISVRPRGGETQPARLSAIELDQRQLLILLGTASGKQFAAIDEILLGVNLSFSRLTPEEAAAIGGPRLQVRSRQGETFASLAASSAIEERAEDIIRLLNRSFPDGDIHSLDSVKTVIIDEQN